MKRRNLFLLIGIEVLILIVFSLDVSIPCLFKSILKVPCPGCGLTRAYHLFLEGKFIDALFQNILFYPIILFMIVFHIILIRDYIHHKELIGEKIIKNKMVWILWIILLIISEVYNLTLSV